MSNKEKIEKYQLYKTDGRSPEELIVEEYLAIKINEIVEVLNSNTITRATDKDNKEWREEFVNKFGEMYIFNKGECEEVTEVIIREIQSLLDKERKAILEQVKEQIFRFHKHEAISVDEITDKEIEEVVLSRPIVDSLEFEAWIDTWIKKLTPASK